MAIATRIERHVRGARRPGGGPARAAAFPACTARRRARCAALPALASLLLLAATASAKVESTAEGIRFSYVNNAAQAVFLAGDFNGWNGTALPMQLDGDRFVAVVRLAPGDHEYKFVVDGQYLPDPDNPVTAGSFGNSLVRVGAKGELLAMEATSDTSLSPKIRLDGRYIGLFIGRRDETNGDRFGLQRPDFTFDLDFKIRMSDALDARVLTIVRSASENTPLWETSLRFDRGSLDLHRSGFALRMFDNDGVGTWEDPLHLVGDIGPYHHDYGYEQQGLRFTTAWHGIEATLLYADNFRAGEPLSPAQDTLAVAAPGVRYDYNLGDSNKNVLALRLEREIGTGLHLGASLRNDRGYNPGVLSQVVVTGDSTRERDSFGRTYEHWTGGGVDARWSGGERWEASGEILYGESSVHTGPGLRQQYRPGTSNWVRVGDAPVEGLSFPIDVSQRWSLGGAVRPSGATRLHAALEWERHGLAGIATDSLRALRNAALVYRAGVELHFGSEDEPLLQLGTDLEVFDFRYDTGTPWNTQLWFADRNFWMEHFQHRLPVGRYVQLGGEDATTWSPWLEWKIGRARPAVCRYEGTIRGSGIDHLPKLYESLFQLTWSATRRVRLYSDTRWVRYDDPVLAIDGGWVSTFAEVEYSFTPDISVALSWGVDPYVLDVVTNEYDAIGRNEFLYGKGATPTVARDRYLNLGALLPRAEQALEDERRVQVEAIVKF